MIFLIDYDRRSGQLVSLVRFQEGERHLAEQQRLESELTLHRSKMEREIVLLEADTEESLRRTHSRYFETIDQIANRGTAVNE